MHQKLTYEKEAREKVNLDAAKSKKSTFTRAQKNSIQQKFNPTYNLKDFELKDLGKEKKIIYEYYP